MELDGSELRAMAAFYARRFPRKADRSRLAQAAGVTEGWTDFSDAGAAWESLLRRAQELDRLGELAELAKAERPRDENLGELARSLKAAGRKSSVLVMVVVGLGGGGLGYVLGRQAGLREAEPQIEAGRAAARAVEANAAAAAEARLVGDAVEEVEGTAAVDLRGIPPEGLEAADGPEAPPEGGSEVEGTAGAGDGGGGEEVRDLALPEAPTPLPEGCAGKLGEVVGWWYAGESEPGKLGYTLTLDRGVRIRSDYPRAENGWLAEAPTRCVLGPGSRLKIAKEPVQIEGGAWWVPVVGDR